MAFYFYARRLEEKFAPSQRCNDLAQFVPTVKVGTWDRYYDFKNIFAEIFGVFDTKQS
jgi:hypothetical protein